MSKRKATVELVRAPRKPFNAPNLMASLQGGPSGMERAQANRAAAILIRQARMNAMPLQRSSVTEKGYVDTPATLTVDTTGDIQLLATIAQGAAVTQRIGKKVMIRSIQLRGYAHAGTAGTYNTGAIILVYDRRPTGALPAVTDILVTANATAMNNDTNSGRFQILRRKDFLIIGNTTDYDNDKCVVQLDDFVTVNRKSVFKAAGTGAIGDIEEGAMYIVTVGIRGAGTTASTAVMNYRTRFTEY